MKVVSFSCGGVAPYCENKPALIASLPDHDVRLHTPIEATVEELDHDNFIASVPDVNLNASGDTWKEAVENLQDIIAGIYRLYRRMPRSALGPEATRQWAFLNSHLR